ncbi:MAG TPA: LytTR family DNA-binding domain-containing protein [Chitinophagaceae bacterium]|nr:LytTR family DNA-binding domain-containing protein [Chitinophagaceae bacterium]
MLKAIIIDDELKGRIALRRKIIDYCKDVQVLGEAENAEQGIELIQKNHPDVIFLDIEMPQMNGFEMLRKIPRKNFHIIFTTAYDQYAITAIKYSAFDYLLKPIDIEELQAAIERIKDLPHQHTGKKIETLEQNLRDKKPFNKIAIPAMDGLHFFDINTIIHLEAQSNYTILYFINHPKVIASKTLKDFEEILPADIFYRTHHSHIINLHCIKRYIKGDGGQVELLDGSYVDVARRKKEEFLQLIGA